VANAAHDLGQALAKRDRFAEAEALLEESLAIERAVSGPAAPAAGVVGAALAEVRRRMGNPAAAEAGFREALATLEAAFPPTHPRVLEARGGLALARADQGEHSEAVDILAEVHGAAVALDDGGVAARLAAEQLAEVWALAGDTARAEVWRREASGGG
jgi:tetratricopeptide (TPR) repeat protein